MTETKTEHGGRTAVLGVDPGTTTGIALAVFSPIDFPMAIWSDQLAWDDASDAVARQLERMRRQLDRGTIWRAVAVGERFTVNAQTARRGQSGAEDAMQMLGVLRREARLTGVEQAKLQQASTAKSLVKDPILRNLKLYAPGLVHVNDAYRHVVAWALSNRALDGKVALRGAEE
jgi:hypothetical protein